MASGSEGSSRKKWAKRLGGATFVAGILATQQPAAAHPAISDLLNRAMARAATASSRREDAEMPAALVLEPAGHGGDIILVGHRSHASHVSHRSATYPRKKGAQFSPYRNSLGAKANAAGNVPAKRQNSRQTIVAVPDGDKIIKLKDGSRLVGRTKALKGRVTVKSKYLSIEVGKREIVSTLAAPAKIDLEKLTAGRCIVKFANGNELRTDAQEQERKIVLIDGPRKRSVPKSRVSRLIHLGEPTRKWGATEKAYCVVTLRDGSVLRGEVWKEKSGGQYMFQNRYGNTRLAKESVFCFEKVEKVFTSRKARVKASAKADKQHTEGMDDSKDK